MLYGVVSSWKNMKQQIIAILTMSIKKCTIKSIYKSSNEKLNTFVDMQNV